jgi:FkbM family methyltransferase
MILTLARKFSGWLRQQPLLGRLALQCMPDVRLKIRVRTIGDFYIRFRRNRSFWLRDPLTHERFPLGALQRLVGPGKVVYDVGANIGLYARFLVTEFKAARVVCFEPMTENRQLLEANARAVAGTAQIQIVPTALSDTDGQEELQVDDMMSGSAVLDRVTGGQPSQGRTQYGLPGLTESVAVSRLDQVVAEENLAPPDVIKVDIEGAELLMLKGARATLVKSRPDLLIELHGVPVAQEVFRFLSELGYACFGEVGGNGKRAYRRLDESIVRGLTDFYDLHFIVASFDPAKLEQPILPYADAA